MLQQVRAVTVSAITDWRSPKSALLLGDQTTSADNNSRHNQVKDKQYRYKFIHILFEGTPVQQTPKGEWANIKDLLYLYQK